MLLCRDQLNIIHYTIQESGTLLLKLFYEKCMRYLNANTEPHATLFKYACKEENGFQLFIEKEESTELTTINEGQNDNDTAKNEGENEV